MTTEDLIQSAIEARRRSYAPYSQYAVGAALRDERGTIFNGCNVENASYPATLCAERVAIGKMISEGGTQIKELAVVTEDGGAPCGLCLQVIREFTANTEELEVHCRNNNGEIKTYRFNELLPVAFDMPPRCELTAD